MKERDREKLIQEMNHPIEVRREKEKKKEEVYLIASNQQSGSRSVSSRYPFLPLQRTNFH